MNSKPKTVVKRVTATLNFPTSNNSFIVFAKSVAQAMTDNAYFTALAPKLTALNADIAALDAAQVACTTVPPTGTVDARNVALEMVRSDLRILRNDVQSVADNDPTRAQAIITSAGMGVKKPGSYVRSYNTAEDGNEEGMVILTGQGSGPHEWRYSTDDSTWNLLPSSRTSVNEIFGLTPGLVYYFQNRMLLTNGLKSDWSQSIKTRVR